MALKPATAHSTPNSSSPEKSLADSLTERGIAALEKGKISGANLFERALSIDPKRKDLLLEQARALYAFASYHERDKAAKLAIDTYKLALKLDPTCFTALYEIGRCYLLRAELTELHHFTLEAHRRFSTAKEHAGGIDCATLSRFEWERGKALCDIGMHTRDPADLEEAKGAFEQALKMQQALPSEFWENYGDLIFELGERTGSFTQMQTALHHYKRGVLSEMTSSERWRALANAMAKVHAYSLDDTYFEATNESFKTTTELDPEDVDAWLSWAKFLITAGRATRDAKRFKLAVDKCQSACELDEDSIEAMCHWAEALAEYGALTDNGALLNEAKDRIVSLYERSDDDAIICYAAGRCIAARGDYFDELEEFYEAIQYFQEGLSIDRTDAELWHAMGDIFTRCGVREEGNLSFELAAKFFKKALEIESTSSRVCDYAVCLTEYGEHNESIDWLKFAVSQFEHGFAMQKRALYIPAHWLFSYGKALDLLGEYLEDEAYYRQAIATFNRLLLVDPDYPDVHFRTALTLAHCGVTANSSSELYKSLHHFRLAEKYAPESGDVLQEWGTALINIALITESEEEADRMFEESERKLHLATQLGETDAYYQLACLYSLLMQPEKALRYIQKADQFDALPEVEELMMDDWLEELHDHERFRDLIMHLEKKKTSSKKRI